MLTQYTYIKPRYQFGKQCIFTVAHAAEESILPEPDLMQNYVMRTHCHRETQLSTQYAVHEAQTARKFITNTGILHTEGGWPREVNARDSEVVQRFRRRVEKDDQWPIRMGALLSTMERHIFQNNALNIHQNFFDDRIPTSMVKEYGIRITNLYEDPEKKSRPVRYLSWSPNDSSRLAAAYGFLEFEEHSADVSPYSYVWDIGTRIFLMLFDDEPRSVDVIRRGTSKRDENPCKALYTFKSTSPLLTVEFNTRDPVLLVSGLITGQVCCWDIRISDKPVQTSHLYVSHRHPAIQALWIPSKANTDFFSSSTDGMVLWWDIRFLKKPTETLVMDLDNPVRADILNSVGVTALQFEPTMSSKFLAGTENGLVVNVNRRTNNPVEKLAIRFECYTGPVIAIDRNPIYTKTFLTVGDWSAKIWADDAKEGYFLTTCDKGIDLNGGCWSRGRCSVFFITNSDGMLEAYDILAGVKTPLTAIRVCRDSLTAIKSHEDGKYLAVGSRNGNVYLLECSEDLMTFTKEEKTTLSAYLERCGRYEKAIDNRLKEIRLIYGSTSDSKTSVTRETKAKVKKKDQKEKKKASKRGSVDKEKLESRKKSRGTKLKGKSTARMSFPEVVNAEINYFNKVEELAAKYVELDRADMEAAQALLKERTAPKPEEEETESEKEELKKRRSIRKIRSRTGTIRSVQRSRVEMKEEKSDDIDLDSIKRRDTKQRGKKFFKKSCPPTVVCKPEICCMDIEAKRKAKWLKKQKAEPEDIEKFPTRSRSFVVENKWFRRLTDYIVHIPQPSLAFKRKILALKDTPPSVIRRELEQAKKEMRAWQEKAIWRRLSSWTIEEKLEAARDVKDAKVAKKVESKQETAKPEEIQKRVSKIKPERPKRPIKDDSRVVKRKQRGRRNKKVRLTQEDIEKQQEEKQKQLWQQLKHKVKQYDEQKLKQKQFYPRISAAFMRISSEELIKDDEGKNESKKHK